MRVGVLVVAHREQQAALAQVLDQLLCERVVLDEAPLVGSARTAARARVIGAVSAHRVVKRLRALRLERHALRCCCDAVVVLAERRREMHDAGAVLGRHEVVREDRQRPPLAIARSEDRSVVGAVALHQGAAGHRLENLDSLASQDRLQAVLRYQEDVLAGTRAHIARARRDRDRNVPGSVHGVVVHTSSCSCASATGSLRNTLGSTTSR